MQPRGVDRLTYTVVVYRGDSDQILRVVPLAEEDQVTAPQRFERFVVGLGETAVLNETDWVKGTTRPVQRKRRSILPEPETEEWELIQMLTYSTYRGLEGSHDPN